jgi:3-oxoacyl-[acyl-carrier protein] reductase
MTEFEVAIITGAASGIGRALATHYATRNVYSVIGTFPGDPHDPEETLRQVKDAGGAAVIHEVDVRSTSSVDAFAQRAVEEYGRLDYAVANAGILRNAPLAEMSDDKWHDMLDVDLTGVLRTLRSAAAHMNNGGAMVAVSSIAGGVYGWDQHAHYAAAKAGVLGLVRSVAVELGGRNIRANTVIPGLIETPQSLDPVNSIGKEGLDRAGKDIPLGHSGRPEDVAEVIGFLTSPASRYVTGQEITVDGGLTIKMRA